jgi:hypothetical protein
MSAVRTRMASVFSLLLALAAGCSQGQTTVTFRSLEARISQTRWVVRGTITHQEKSVIVAPGGHSTDGTVWPDGIVVYKATVNAEEVLKGPQRKQIVLQRQTSAFDKRFEQWRDAHTAFLWFVGDDAPPSNTETSEEAASPSWDALRLAPPVAAEKVYVDVEDAPPVFGMDFTVLSTPAVILARARAFAKRCNRTAALHTFTIPSAVAKQCGSTGDANFLVVPVLPSLERIARRMVTAPQGFVPGEERSRLDSLTRSQLRLGGVDALRYFRSPTNVRFLKALLSDETVVYQTLNSGEQNGVTVKQYPLRSRAYEILTGWGIDVTRPMLE